MKSKPRGRRSIAAFESQLRELHPTADEWLPSGVLLLREATLDDSYATVHGWDVGVHMLRDTWELVAIESWWQDGTLNADDEFESPTHASPGAALESWDRFWRRAESEPDDWAPVEIECEWSVTRNTDPIPLRYAPRDVLDAAIEHLPEVMDRVKAKEAVAR